MIRLNAKGPGGVPIWALILSTAAWMVPVVGELLLPEEVLEAYQALIWLVILFPALILAYHKGWKGTATAVTAGIAALVITQALSARSGLGDLDLLAGIVVALLGLSLGIGWMAERLHRDRVEVEELALTDLLTHLPNRRHVLVFLDNEFAAAKRGRPLSVVLFDLDNFKIYNDRYGHQAGDEALKVFAGILSDTTRKMNLSARFGGEEFLSVLAGSDPGGAIVFAERVRTSLKSAKLPRGAVTVSAGVAPFHQSMASPDELLAAADHALYQAKREGRNRVRLFGGNPLDEGSTDGRRGQDEDSGRDSGDYDRVDGEVGRGRRPVTLLPHKVTGFGLDRRLLLVADEAPVRDLFSSYLEKEGFEVTAAGDATGALKALDSEFDVVITDLAIPDDWGLELVSAVRARWPHTQVIVVFGETEDPVKVERLKNQVDRHLQKPFGMAQLRAELQECLSRRVEAGHDRIEKRVASAEAKVRSDAAREHLQKGIQSLIDAVEIRDPGSFGHHQRVTLYAQAILGSLDPKGTSVSRTSLALGTRHMDIGKVGIPDRVLNNPGTLLPEDREFLKEHTEVGRRILGSILDDEVALEVVTWHHERWDGNGYPNGLVGEAIPLSARIAAVADSLDALTSPRPHRQALSWEDAVTQVIKEAGTRFDPRVVEAFRSALPQLTEIWEELAEEAPPRSATNPR
jgi:diguanylate cyclase (GGDEF)-like protein